MNAGAEGCPGYTCVNRPLKLRPSGRTGAQFTTQPRSSRPHTVGFKVTYVYPGQKIDRQGTRGRPTTDPPSAVLASLFKIKPIPLLTPIPLSLSPTMGAFKTLAAFTLFFVSSLAASANDWRSRSIYQVSHIPCLPFPALTPNVASLSRTGSRLRMGPDQPVTRRTASIAVAPTKAS